MNKLRVKTDKLNLRSEPVVREDTFIASLPLGHPVNVIGDAERQGWKEIETELEGSMFHGVVSGKYLREPESGAKEALLSATVKEWIRFERDEGKEHHNPYFQFVGEMWQALGMALDGRDREIPWSAAFISFVVRNAGYQGFRFAAAHARYIHDAIVKRQQGAAEAPFWGFRLSEHRPKLGDLVCQWREVPRTFAEVAKKDAFKSHCDVIVEIKDTFVRAIGGNVRQSVAMKTFSLNSRRFLKNTNRVFAILRNNL